jgi:K+-transporting ATPase KdpF subunit
MRQSANGADMFDQIVGLILSVLALIYLVYAMLRPERF